MANTFHEYGNIAPYYERWSSGDAAYEETRKFYTRILTQFQFGRFLELGVGTGSISLSALQYAPISLVGVDNCREMLRECQSKLASLSKRLSGTMTLQQCDFCEMDFHEEFDGAILPFRTIGHLLTNRRLKTMFCRVFQALKPGGWFVFDHYMFQQDWAKAHNDVDILMYQDPDLTICDHYLYDFAAGYMHCTVKINGNTTESFDFRWLPVPLLENIIQKAGFLIVQRLGDFDGRPWTEDALEQIWLLQKPGRSSTVCLPNMDRSFLT